MITTPPEGAQSFTSKQLSFSSEGKEGRFSCFHCGAIPVPGDVIIADMNSGRKGVLIVQKMDPKSDTFTDTGLRFGLFESICYLEDVPFSIPPPAKLGFFL